MKYKDIFNRVRGGNIISVSTYCLESAIINNQSYIAFCNEKVALRKQIESKYKNLYQGNLSFRVYLESITNRVYKEVFLHTQYNYNSEQYDHFGEQSEFVYTDISEIIRTFITKHSSFNDEMVNMIMTTANYVSNEFNKVGLSKFFIRGVIDSLYYLKNAEVGLTLYFTLNEESRKIFENVVVDDHGEAIGNFDDVSIYENNKVLMSSTTHEDFYYFDAMSKKILYNVALKKSTCLWRLNTTSHTNSGVGYFLYLKE